MVCANECVEGAWVVGDGNVNMLWHWQLLGTLLMAVQATSLLEEALHAG